ncbi:MAG: hypothetical protein LBP24_04985, partial [Coriobacteriales bacterium]|nr:hypothetical protein [Coriobacteriales bacterium]
NPAIFDDAKLAWINASYLKEQGAPAFVDALLPYLQNVGLTRGGSLVLSKDGSPVATPPASPEAVAADIASNRPWYEAIYPLVAERAKTMAEVVPMTAYLFSGDTVALDADSVEKCLHVDGAGEVLALALDLLASPALQWEAAAVEAALRTIPEKLGVKPKLVFQALRVAVCGNMVSPPLFESLELLGREHTLARIRRAQDQ